jgi:hypothetical protein
MVYAVTVHRVHQGIRYSQNVICLTVRASTHACVHTHTHTHTHARANYFIYAYTESKAFPESSFTRLINAQQCYVHISYQISPKSDNKCAKYGYKLIYTAK